MSGQRASHHDPGVAGAPTSPRRVTAIAVLAGVLSLVICGAVAQASAGAGTGIGAGGASKSAAAAPTTTVVAGDDAVPPDGLGDDPELDALAQSCFDGDLVACDQLFLRAPVDSDYETYGDTCGGRREEGTGQYCGLEAGAEPTGTPSGEPVPPDDLGDDSELDVLAQSCYAGDMEACDDLYGSADSGSAYQVYGDTCAGRQPENTGRYCTALEDPVPGTGAVATTAPDASTTVTDETTTTSLVTTGPTDTSQPTESSEPIDSSAPTEPGIVPTPTLEPTGLGDDPALDALAQSCYDGDLASCDDLYRDAEPGTPYRTYGDTCAGRQAEGTGTWCVDAFASGGTTTSTDTTPTTPSTTSTTAVPPSPTTTALPATTGVPTSAVPPTSTAGDVIPPPTLEPTGLGTDAVLDALAQSCYTGEMVACDDLWRESEPETAYRNFGDTCAGRQAPNTGTWCADAFPGGGSTTSTSGAPGPTTVPDQTTVPGQTAPTDIPDATQQPTGLGEDPAFDALAGACFDGDMQACDDLFDQAPIGSDYRAYGDTCAGRQEPGTFKYCHVVFPAGSRR